VQTVPCTKSTARLKLTDFSSAQVGVSAPGGKQIVMTTAKPVDVELMFFMDMYQPSTMPGGPRNRRSFTPLDQGQMATRQFGYSRCADWDNKYKIIWSPEPPPSWSNSQLYLHVDSNSISLVLSVKIRSVSKYAFKAVFVTFDFNAYEGGECTLPDKYETDSNSVVAMLQATDGTHVSLAYDTFTESSGRSLSLRYRPIESKAMCLSYKGTPSTDGYSCTVTGDALTTQTIDGQLYPARLSGAQLTVMPMLMEGNSFDATCVDSREDQGDVLQVACKKVLLKSVVLNSVGSLSVAVAAPTGKRMKVSVAAKTTIFIQLGDLGVRNLSPSEAVWSCSDAKSDLSISDITFLPSLPPGARLLKPSAMGFGPEWLGLSDVFLMVPDTTGFEFFAIGLSAKHTDKGMACTESLEYTASNNDNIILFSAADKSTVTVSVAGEIQTSAPPTADEKKDGPAPRQPSEPQWMSYCPFVRDGSSSLRCNGHGTCEADTDASRWPPKPTCTCDTGYTGTANCRSLGQIKEQAVTNQAVADNMAKVLASKDAAAKCRGSKTTPAYCPIDDDFPAEFQGTCQASPRACFGSDTAKLKEFASQTCPTGEKMCFSVGGCIRSDVQCGAAASACALGYARCPDMSCVLASDISTCPAADACPDAAKSVRCEDGMTCAEDKHTCQKLVKRNGCPAGKVACPQDSTLCAESSSACAKEVGCPSGTKKCGIERDSDGKAVIDLDTLLPKPLCKAACNEAVAAILGAKPADAKVDITAGVRMQHSVEASGTSSAKLAALDVPASALPIDTGVRRSAKVSTRAISTFTLNVQSVADNTLELGAFAALHGNRTLMAAPLTVKFDKAMDFPDPICFDWAIADENAAADTAVCKTLLSKLEVVSVQNVEDRLETPAKMGTCQFVDPTETTLGTCTCRLCTRSCCSTFVPADTTAMSSIEQKKEEKSSLSPAPRLQAALWLVAAIAATAVAIVVA